MVSIGFTYIDFLRTSVILPERKETCSYTLITLMHSRVTPGPTTSFVSTPVRGKPSYFPLSRSHVLVSQSSCGMREGCCGVIRMKSGNVSWGDLTSLAAQLCLHCLCYKRFPSDNGGLQHERTPSFPSGLTMLPFRGRETRGGLFRFLS